MILAVRRRRALLITVCLLLAAGLAPAEAQVTYTPFTIVVIPDTQIYVQTDEGTETFAAQFEWVADNKDARNIIFVSHEGDVAQNPSSTAEWDRIEGVFQTLDATDIPYAIAPGNHDIEADGSAPEYDTRFGSGRFAGQAWYGGSHAAEGNRSSFQTVSVQAHDLLFVHVRHLQPQFGDVAPVLAWVDSVLKAHPDRLAFVTTHEFTATDGSVVIPALQSVIEDNCNVAAVFSGHRTSGPGRGTFQDDCGRNVHHVLTNYQSGPGGGEGYLRTVEIDPLTLIAGFEVYSPTLDRFGGQPNESFPAQLASLVPVSGDASCDRDVSIGDALMVAQYAVGTRTARSGCPLIDPGGQLDTTAADVNADNVVDLADALLIAQCTVGLTNVFCR